MFNVTNFGLGLGICIVFLVIFIHKYLVNLNRISFCEWLKIHIMIIFKFDLKNLNYQKPKTSLAAFKKKCWRDVFEILIIKIVLIKLEKGHVLMKSTRKKIHVKM